MSFLSGRLRAEMARLTSLASVIKNNLVQESKGSFLLSTVNGTKVDGMKLHNRCVRCMYNPPSMFKKKIEPNYQPNRVK